MDKKAEDITGYYIQPSFSKMIITYAGNICDFAGANNLGLWDPSTMKNLNLITGIPLQDSQLYVKPFPGGNGNRIIMFSADKFQILDMDNKKDPLIWEKISSTDDIQQVAVNKLNQNELYVLMTSGFLNVWDIQQKKIIQEFQTIRKMYRRIQIFPDGKNFALQDKQGYEINIIERSSGIESKLGFKSPASRFLILNNTDLAIVFKNIIQIRSISKGLQDIQANLICEDPDEVFESIALINDNKFLLAAGEKGIIRIWDLQTQKLKCQLDTNQFNADNKLSKLTHIHSILYLPTLNSIGALNSEERRFRIFSVGDFNNPDFAKSFQFGKEVSTCINSYETAFAINGKNLIGLLSVKGTFTEEEVQFTKEIEILDLNTSQIIASKDLSLPGFTLLQQTMRSNGKNKMFYLMKNDTTQDSVFIEFNVSKYLELPLEKRLDQEANRNLYETAYPYTVQQDGINAIFTPVSSHIERIIVPFSIQISNEISKEFGFIPIKDTSGIAIYDYQIKQVWIHKFEEQYTAKFATMIDENTIAFIDKNNCVQIWNILTNSMISNEAPEDKFNISLFTNSEKHFLIVEPSNELRILEQDTCDQVNSIKLKESEVIKSLQIVGDNSILVLYYDDSVQKITIDDGIVVDSINKKPIANFSVLPLEDKSKEPLVLLLNEEYLEIRDFKSI